jgi:hypothetical protein
MFNNERLETFSYIPNEYSLCIIADRGRQVDLSYPGTVLYVDTCVSSLYDEKYVSSLYDDMYESQSEEMFLSIPKAENKYITNSFYEGFVNNYSGHYDLYLYNKFDVVIDVWNVLLSSMNTSSINEWKDYELIPKKIEFAFNLLKPEGFIIASFGTNYISSEKNILYVVKNYNCELFEYKSCDVWDINGDWSEMNQHQKIIISTREGVEMLINLKNGFKITEEIIAEHDKMTIATEHIEEFGFNWTTRDDSLFFAKYNLNQKKGMYVVKITRK